MEILIYAAFGAFALKLLEKAVEVVFYMEDRYNTDTDYSDLFKVLTF